MNQEIICQNESSVRSYCRKFPKVFYSAKNAYMYTETDEAYLDFFCGAGALNYGHNNEYIKGKVVEYIANDRIMHSLDMYTSIKGEFLNELVENVFRPKNLTYKVMFTGPTGTNANEAALKLARKVTGRKNIFALMGAFHGMTLGALALTTDESARKGSGITLHDVTHIPAPYMFPELDTIQYMEALLEDDHSGVDKPAALVIETVQAEGGVYVLSIEWLKKAREFCTKNDILLIVDDIQVGNCRTGDFFSFERAGIQPDIVTISKSIGGIGMPLALTFYKPELDIWAPGEHNGTFRGFQPALVAGKAGLEFMREHNIEGEVKRKEKVIQEYMEKNLLTIDRNIQFRGIGLIWGIDFKGVGEGIAKKVSEECFDRHLIIELAGRKDNVLKIMPPLTIDDKELIIGLDIIMDAIRCVIE